MSGLLRAIRSGELAGWKGLADLSVAELTATFPRDSDWSGTAKLGRRRRETDYLWARMPDCERTIRVWFEGDRVLLVDFECSWTFKAGPAGEEPVLLDTWLGTLPMPKSERVFPRHGLAAFVNGETGKLWHLALFPPQTLESYVDHLRIDMQRRRHQEQAPAGED